MIRNIMLLHRDQNRGRSLVNIISGSNLKTTVESNIAEAIKKLMNENYDLFMIDASLQNPSPIDLFSKFREKKPNILRALIVDSGIGEFNYDDLINKAAICAVFHNPLDRNYINKIIDEFSKGSVSSEEVTALKAKIEELDKKLKKTEKDLRIARAADNIQKEDELNVAELKSKQASSKLGVEIKIDYRAENLQEEIENALSAMIDSPSVILPVPPKVAQEVKKLMEEPEVKFDKIADVVSLEASISSKVLKICNSPIYAGIEPITNIHQAISRLGLDVMKDIIQTAANESLFKTEIKGMENLMNRLWMHSLIVAHSNMLVTENLGIDNAKDFFLMGLLHDIGKLLIAILIQQGFDNGLWNLKMVTPAMIMDIFDKKHTEFGVRLLEKWKYPKMITEVIQYHNDDEHVYQHSEHVVVTYYSNILARKLGHSFKKYEEGILNGHDLAQALNLNPQISATIEQSSISMVQKIKDTYFS